jgi:hypothetical protein
LQANPLNAYFFHPLQDLFQSFSDSFVGDPKNQNSFGSKDVISNSITFQSTVVYSPIHFHHQLCLVAIEIYDKTLDNVLASKVTTGHLVSSEPHPKHTLGRRHIPP